MRLGLAIYKHMIALSVVYLWGYAAYAQSGGPALADAVNGAQYGCLVFESEETISDHENCAAEAGDGSFMIAQSIVKRLDFEANGLVSISIRYKGPAYVREDGYARTVMPFDNGPDYFNNGLARTVIDGKIGFLDEKLDIKIPAIFDGAYPFSGGYARACIGCRRVSDGEHSWYDGGEEICINASGERRPLKDCERGPKT